MSEIQNCKCEFQFFTGTELSFEAKKYAVGDKVVVIKSSRDLKGNDDFKLNKLVDLKCIPDDVITLDGKKK